MGTESLPIAINSGLNALDKLGPIGSDRTFPSEPAHERDKQQLQEQDRNGQEDVELAAPLG